MKTIIGLFCLLVIRLNVSAQFERGYQIMGNVKDLPNGINFYLIGTKEDGGADTIAIVKSKDNKFIIKGKIELEAQMYFVKMDTSSLKLPGNRQSWVRLLLDNSKIELNGRLEDWPEVEVKGSLPTDEYNRFVKTIREARENANNRMMNANRDSIIIAEAQEEYNKEFIKALEKIPNSFAVPLFILNNSVLKLDALNFAYNKLSKKQKDSFYGIKLRERIELTTLSQNIRIGNEMPDFQIKNSKGISQSVKQIVAGSKITLIDFWASWCSPCRDDIPNLKKVYAAFSENGFNILSISIDKNSKDWEKALNEEKMPWINGLELNGVSKKLFGITAIPAQILINNKFQIIAMDYVGGGYMQRTKYIIQDKGKKGLRGNDLYEVVATELKVVK
ncbi:AhpC/TSA family protein [Chitinophaga niabensis]|uniref:Thiol-disulfide isomerase or thioredoxin n=1 Tax=Chitinophaga niabensis TaxID=536979 RepID=A0A1N6JY87_9BACT|nr:AhpC/TSA family protein [Chitinophaga niabensis]SIO49305.1 Thiol-disulfide isomerase or thioredoxin [Chitinophaga niabensis]